MIKKKLYLLFVVPMIFILAACSAANGTTGTGAQNAQGAPVANGTPQPGQPGMGNMPLEDKLAIGTLKMEGTDKAVTAEEARALLPLWKAMKSLSSSSTTSQEELTALYKQIEESMTSDQIKLITDLNLSQTDMQALMTQYGAKMPQFSGTRMPNSTRAANSSGSNQGGGDPGGGPGGGGMPPDGGGGPGGFQQGGGTGAQSAQRTPQAGQASQARGPRAGGTNLMLMDPLIKLLQTRAGA